MRKTSASTDQRASRLAKQIQQIVAETLRYHSKNPLLEFLTITDVKVTRDLQTATIFWTHLDENKEYEIDSALKKMIGRIRTALAGELTTRLTPKISFKFDLIGSQVADVEDLLQIASVRDGETEIKSQTAKHAGDENPYKEKRIVTSDDFE